MRGREVFLIAAALLASCERTAGPPEPVDPPAAAPATPAPPPTVEPPLQDLPWPDQVAEHWRDSIVHFNPEAVDQARAEIDALGPDALPVLRRLAVEDPEERVRAYSVRVLGQMQAAEGPFLRDLLNDTSEHVRANAAWALGRIGFADAAEDLRRLEREDVSELVRREAGTALAEMTQ